MDNFSKRSRPLVDPILNAQAGNLPEVSDIAHHKRRPPSQGNGGDEKIGAANLFEFLVLKQAVEFGCGRGV